MGKKTTGTKPEREAVKRYLQQYHAAKQKNAQRHRNRYRAGYRQSVFLCLQEPERG